MVAFLQVYVDKFHRRQLIDLSRPSDCVKQNSLIGLNKVQANVLQGLWKLLLNTCRPLVLRPTEHSCLQFKRSSGHITHFKNHLTASNPPECLLL